MINTAKEKYYEWLELADKFAEKHNAYLSDGCVDRENCADYKEADGDIYWQEMLRISQGDFTTRCLDNDIQPFNFTK